MKTRLFIGNLASTVSQEELRDKFSSLLAGHKGEADVGNVEVRCKNENNYFGYVDVHLSQSTNPGNNSTEGNSQTGGGVRFSGIPSFLRKYIDLMNNTKWKGSLIKVQLAKESFIDKLKREQQENRRSDLGNHDVNSNKPGQAPSASQNSEQSRNQRQANDILNKLNRSTKEKGYRSNKFQQSSNTGSSSNTPSNYGFEIVTNDKPTSNNSSRKSPVKTSSPPTKPAKKHSKKSKSSSSSSSEDESDDDVRDGIPKFKGLLLSYPEGLPKATPFIANIENEKEITTAEEELVEEEETPIQQKLLSIAFDKDHVKSAPVSRPAPASSSKKCVVNFNKNKQQQSDLLRLQSMEKMKELKTQRKNLINSALSTVAASAPLSEQRKMLESEDSDDDRQTGTPTRKKTKMTLFDDEEDDDDNELENGDDFKVKKQFEGAGGQKLLELKTRWGNDNRFQIDDRFKDSDADEDADEPMEQEKEKQLDILTGIIGKVMSSKGAPGMQKKGASAKDPAASVIMPRFDPEAEAEYDNDNGENTDRNKEKEPKSVIKSGKEKDAKSHTTEGGEKTVRSTEPATFKTVSNLKSLFSSDGDKESGQESTSLLFKAPPVTQQSSFSLLATFGKTDSDSNTQATNEVSTKKSSAASGDAPRTFWQSNPFRYDSSDDEGENDNNKVKVTIKSKPETPLSLFVHGKLPFFFSKNDVRFEGLEDYFLKYEETGKENGDAGIAGGAEGTDVKKEPIEDFAVKRQELKSIVKAKIRNTRRKDEKRTLAIKRAIRKRKRKIQHKSRSFSKF